jgi:hypothetical protein
MRERAPTCSKSVCTFDPRLPSYGCCHRPGYRKAESIESRTRQSVTGMSPVVRCEGGPPSKWSRLKSIAQVECNVCPHDIPKSQSVPLARAAPHNGRQLCLSGASLCHFPVWRDLGLSALLVVGVLLLERMYLGRVTGPSDALAGSSDVWCLMMGWTTIDS